METGGWATTARPAARDPRGDAPLLRHLAGRFGAATAAAWRRMPYVRLPDDGFLDYLIAHARELIATLPAVAHVPWDEVVLDFALGHAAVANALRAARGARANAAGRPVLGAVMAGVRLQAGRCWMRLATLPRYLETLDAAAPWCVAGGGAAVAGRGEDAFAAFRARAERYLVLEVWDEAQLPRRPTSGGLDAAARRRVTGAIAAYAGARGGRGGLASRPTTILLPRDAPWDEDERATGYLNLRCLGGRAYGPLLCALPRCRFPEGDARQFACRGQALLTTHEAPIALLTLAYLTRCDEHLVEVAPARAEAEEALAATSAPSVASSPAATGGAVGEDVAGEDAAGEDAAGEDAAQASPADDTADGAGPPAREGMAAPTTGQAAGGGPTPEDREEPGEITPRYYILLDPTRAGDYGQPGPAGPASAARRAPRPHTRRGHWRTLRAEAFGDRRGARIWVKQAWIGPRAWAHEGQRYRVVSPLGGAGGAGDGEGEEGARAPASARPPSPSSAPGGAGGDPG